VAAHANTTDTHTIHTTKIRTIMPLIWVTSMVVIPIPSAGIILALQMLVDLILCLQTPGSGPWWWIERSRSHPPCAHLQLHTCVHDTWDVQFNLGNLHSSRMLIMCWIQCLVDCLMDFSMLSTLWITAEKGTHLLILPLRRKLGILDNCWSH